MKMSAEKLSRLQKLILMLALEAHEENHDVSTRTIYRHYYQEGLKFPEFDLPSLSGHKYSRWWIKEYVVVSKSLRRLRERGLVAIRPHRPGLSTLIQITKEGIAVAKALLLRGRPLSLKKWLVAFRASPAELTTDYLKYIEERREIEQRFFCMALKVRATRP
jgi:hypothetical protein